MLCTFDNFASCSFLEKFALSDDCFCTRALPDRNFDHVDRFIQVDVAVIKASNEDRHLTGNGILIVGNCQNRIGDFPGSPDEIT